MTVNKLWPNIPWAMINFPFVPLCCHKTVETNFLVSALIIFIRQTEDAGDRPTGHYDEFGFMVEGGK